VHPCPKATVADPAPLGWWIPAAALDDGAHGTLEKKTLTGIVALPFPGAAAAAKSPVLASRGRPGEAEVAVSDPAIEEPGAALSYATATLKSHL
jgi:hypothetical protein